MSWQRKQQVGLWNRLIRDVFMADPDEVSFVSIKATIPTIVLITRQPDFVEVGLPFDRRPVSEPVRSVE